MKGKFKKILTSVLMSTSLLIPSMGLAAENQVKEIPFPSEGNSMGLMSIASFSDGMIGNGNVQAKIGTDGRFSAGLKEIQNENWFRVIYGWSGSTGTSFTTVKVDGADKVFGNSQDGTFITTPHNVDDQTNEAVWKTGDISVKQALKTTINPATGIDDALQIRYTVTNTGSQQHEVGLRIMLDTMVGWNDSAPFQVPTQNGIESIDYEKNFEGANIPEFWQAFQSFDNPDISAQYTMHGSNATAPDRFVISNWGSIVGTKWDYTTRENQRTGDSAVGMWWNPVTIAPGSTKTITTYYGRPGVGGDQTLVLSGRQRLTYNEWSSSTTNLIAYLNNNTGSSLDDVRLELIPSQGVSLVDNDSSHTVGALPLGTTTQTTWRIQPTQSGIHNLTVNAFNGDSTEPFATSQYEIEAMEPVIPPNITLGGDRGTDNAGNPIAGRTSPLTVNASFDNPEAIGVTLIATDADGDRYEAEMLTTNGVDWSHTFVPYQNGLWETPLNIQVIPRYANGSTGEPQSFDIILIDPRGIVYNAAQQQGDSGLPSWPLPGATVTLQYNDPELGTWVNMSEEAYPGRLSPITNPQMTGEDGVYAWDVAEGQYRVVVSRPGFETATSRSVDVPPPVMDLHIGLTPTDTVSPSLSVVGAVNGGTYTGPVTINFSASDNEAGVRSITYQIGESAEQVVNGSSGSFAISDVGTHTIHFTVVDHAGNVAQEEIAFTIAEGTEELKINSLTADLPSPQQVGNTIRWTADVTGTGVTYEWNVYKDGVRISDVSFSQENNYIDWTPSEPGNYQAMVAVRDGHGFDHMYSDNFAFITDPAKEELAINSITADLVSPQQIGNTIRWTADVDGNELKYEWNIYKDGALIQHLPVSQQNYVELTPDTEGVYKVMVAVRDIYGDFDHKYSNNFIFITESEVEELKINSISPDLLSPQEEGSSIRWTADANGNGLKYEWSIYKDGVRITNLPFAAQNYLDITSAEAGKYRIKVGVKDIFGGYKYLFSEDFIVNEAEIIVEAEVVQPEQLEVQPIEEGQTEPVVE